LSDVTRFGGGAPADALSELQGPGLQTWGRLDARRVGLVLLLFLYSQLEEPR